MIVLNPESWFVKYWIRWGCSYHGYAKMLKIPPYDNTDYCERIEVKTGTNLCQIGRVCIYAFIKTLLAGILISATGSWILFNPISFISVIGVIAISLLIAYGMLKAIQCTQRFIYLGRPPKQPNLIIEWVKAKKGKFCPRVEFMQPNSTPSNTPESSSSI